MAKTQFSSASAAAKAYFDQHGLDSPRKDVLAFVQANGFPEATSNNIGVLKNRLMHEGDSKKPKASKPGATKKASAKKPATQPKAKPAPAAPSAAPSKSKYAPPKVVLAMSDPILAEMQPDIEALEGITRRLGKTLVKHLVDKYGEE